MLEAQEIAVFKRIAVKVNKIQRIKDALSEINSDGKLLPQNGTAD